MDSKKRDFNEKLNDKTQCWLIKQGSIIPLADIEASHNHNCCFWNLELALSLHACEKPLYTSPLVCFGGGVVVVVITSTHHH